MGRVAERAGRGREGNNLNCHQGYFSFDRGTSFKIVVNK